VLGVGVDHDGAAVNAPDADAVRALRKASGLTQPAFAALAYATKGACAQWEAGGTVDPRSWALLRAGVALHLGDQAGALAVLRETLPA
jgi:hypothetical protein